MRSLTMLLIVIVLAAALAGQADVPTKITYQGVLKDDQGDLVPDSTYDLTFRIYTAYDASTPIWEESQTAVVHDGIVSAALGFMVPLDMAFDVPYWLGIAIEGESELLPRAELMAVPYAHRARSADEVTGGVGDTDWTESGGHIYRIDGNVGIGLDAPWKRLHIKEEVAGGISYAVKLENPSSQAGTATGILFKVDSSNEDRGKGAIVYERTATWNRGNLHFLQNSSANSSQATLANAAMTIKNNGNVGIGTTDPRAKLEVTSHIRSTGYSWPVTGKGLELAYNDVQHKGYVFAYDRDLGVYGDLALGSGNVGIGTNYPAEQLHVSGVVYSASGGFKFPDGTVQTTANGGSGGGLVLPYAGTAATTAAALAATNTNASGEGVAGTHGITGNYGWLGTSTTGVTGYNAATYVSGALGAVGRGVEGTGGTDGTGVYGSAYNAYGVHGYANGESTAGVFGEVTKTSSAAVLGTNTGASTTGKLGTDLAGVYGNGAAYGVHGVSSTGGHAVYGANSSGTAVSGVTTTGTGVSGVASTGIAVSGSCATGGYAGDFRGNVRVRSIGSGDTIIEFGEGLDYAEGFDVAGPGCAEPGDVLIIDPVRTGELSLSCREYDTRVAGIVAGANGLGSAVRLGGDRFDLDVALAGRVYCNVDASEVGVEPGDLLTTSGTQGYAMKVTDPTRAQGAILGKAMERLEQGERGQILVLVTLQ